MHVMKDYCPEGDCLAGEFCPAESVVMRSFLDYSRTSYGVGVDDSGVLLGTWTAKGPCPVHNGQAVPPPVDPNGGGETPEGPVDPNHPPTVDPSNPPGGEGGTPPTPPVTPEPPKEDWVDNLWG